MAGIGRLFERESRDCLDEFIKERCFSRALQGESREEVLNNLCECVREKQGLPEDFCGGVVRKAQFFTDRLRQYRVECPSGSGIQRADIRCGGSASKTGMVVTE